VDVRRSPASAKEWRRETIQCGSYAYQRDSPHTQQIRISSTARAAATIATADSEVLVWLTGRRVGAGLGAMPVLPSGAVLVLGAVIPVLGVLGVLGTRWGVLVVGVARPPAGAVVVPVGLVVAMCGTLMPGTAWVRVTAVPVCCGLALAGIGKLGVLSLLWVVVVLWVLVGLPNSALFAASDAARAPVAPPIKTNPARIAPTSAIEPAVVRALLSIRHSCKQILDRNERGR
jgi:hypothetical protein